MSEENQNEIESGGPVTRRKFEEEIILKAWKDPEYKKRLLESPKEVFQEELRKIRAEATLPENLEVYIHEETPNAVHMTLPINPAEYGEISDEAWLESAAGGGVFVAANGVGVLNAVVAANAVGAVNVVVVGSPEIINPKDMTGLDLKKF